MDITSHNKILKDTNTKENKELILYRNKYLLERNEHECIIDLENKIGPIPIKFGITAVTFGIQIENNHVIGLGLYNQQLEAISETIGNLTTLSKLNLSRNKLTALPESIGKLTSLTYLNLSKNRLSSLPETICNLKNLTNLNLHDNMSLDLSNIDICKFKSLTNLNLACNDIDCLPENIGRLTLLKDLNVWNNKIKCLPESFGNLNCLKMLNLYANPFNTNELPENVRNSLKKLQKQGLWVHLSKLKI